MRHARLAVILLLAVVLSIAQHADDAFAHLRVAQRSGRLDQACGKLSETVIQGKVGVEPSYRVQN